MIVRGREYFGVRREAVSATPLFPSNPREFTCTVNIPKSRRRLHPTRIFSNGNRKWERKMHRIEKLR
jgi:hypothetical protein